MRTMRPYEDSAKWWNWAEEYAEEMWMERQRRILKADAEACGIIWEPEGGDDDGLPTDGCDVW